jgi:hypothetical protein
MPSSICTHDGDDEGLESPVVVLHKLLLEEHCSEKHSLRPSGIAWTQDDKQWREEFWWSKGFIKVYSLYLSISLSNKARFIPDHSAMLICFILEDPLSANEVMFSRTGNQGPNIIFGELMELIMHGRHPSFIM